MRRASMFLCLTLAACGGDKGVPTDSAEPVAGEGDPTSTAPAPTAPTNPMDTTGPIAIPKAVPADAGFVFAGRVDRPVLDMWMSADFTGTRDLAEAQATVKELDEFVHSKLGLRVAKMQGVTMFARGEDGAAIVSGISGTPTLKPAGEHAGTAIFEFERKGRIALVGEELIVGTEAGVHAAIDAATGKVASFADAPHELGKAWQSATPGAWVGAVLTDEQIEGERDFRPALKAGAEAAMVTFGSTGWSARVFGAPDKMSLLADQARGVLALGLTAAEGAKSEAIAGDDVLVGVGAILGVQSARDLQRAVKIEAKDRVFTVSMPVQLGNIQGGALFIPVVGIAAAIAIPALSKYMRRAKTSEARAQLAKMFDATSAFFHEEHVMRGATLIIGQDPVGPPPHRCPMYEGKPVGATPLTPPTTVDCNLGPGGRCVPSTGGGGPGHYDIALWNDDPVWNQLNFMQEQAHYFHYRYRYSNAESGYGACQFTVQAFADLDGDGVFSTYERSGAADINGVNGAAGLFIDQEVE